MTGKDKVKVYLDWINYKGDVTERVLIAEFRNRDWARRFVEETKATFDGDALVKVTVE